MVELIFKIQAALSKGGFIVTRSPAKEQARKCQMFQEASNDLIWGGFFF